MAISTTILDKGSQGKQLPFPTSQSQMAQYQKDYYFDKIAKSWFTKPRVGASTGSSAQVPQSLVDKFESIKQQASTAGQRILTEGITGSGGQTLMPAITPETTVGQLKPIQQTALNLYQPSQAPPASGGGAGEGGGEGYTPQRAGEGEVPKDIMQNIQLADTDLANIINDISSGAIKDVGVEIADEAKRLAISGEDSKLKQAISQTQQAMAKRGMAFSGIRTNEEERLVAGSLAAKAGISNKFAAAIVAAARDEQQRREQANISAQNAQNAALKAMGYVIDPVSGGLVKTLERERFEQPEGATADIQEYEYAKQQGYTGSFEEWQRQGKVGTVGWSQWAAELGIVGMNYENAMPILTKAAQDRNKDTVARQKASLNANIYEWLSKDEKERESTENFIDIMFGQYDVLDRQTIEAFVNMGLQRNKPEGLGEGVKGYVKEELVEPFQYGAQALWDWVKGLVK